MRRRFPWYAVLGAVICLLPAPLHAATDAELAAQVKAAFLFNFLKYVTWPEESEKTRGTIDVCIAGEDPFGPALEQTFRDRMLDERPLAVRRLKDPAEDASGCHLTFIASTGAERKSWFQALEGKPVLTVGESPNFLAEGGMIALLIESGKVRFDVNLAAIKNSDLEVSSRFLSLARNVTGGT